MERVADRIDIETFPKGPTLTWEGISDEVMGGSSVITAIAVYSDSNAVFLRMEGRVSTENGGGFIQARTRFPSGKLDASQWKGIEIRVRGREGPHEVHLRTPSCRMPWAYFGLPFQPPSTWEDIRFPFDDFSGNAVSPGPLEIGSILSIGLLAVRAEFSPCLDIARISLYR